MEDDIKVYNIICPKNAYDRLQKAGLIELLKRKQQKVVDFLLIGDFGRGAESALKLARENFYSPQRKISEQSEMFKDMLEFEIDFDDSMKICDDFQRISLKHPSLLVYLLLGESVLDYKKFGFPTRRSLEESIASYCIGERLYLSPNREWVWRNGIYRFEISQNIHGDLSADQVDVSGVDETEKTLFGDVEKFDIIKIRSHDFQGVFAYQDWSQFLMATLRYAQELGKSREPVIMNWKLVLEKIGAVGTNSAEAEFGLGFNPVDFLFEQNVLTKGKKLQTTPLSIYSDSRLFIPYINDSKLTYLIEDKDGDIEIEGQGRLLDGKRFRKVLEYSEQDLPEVLKANYRFFARDRSVLYHIMDRFIQETR